MYLKKLLFAANLEFDRRQNVASIHLPNIGKSIFIKVFIS